MPFPPHTFRHTPALRGRITPPSESAMRFGQERYDELDAQALAEGWPDGWRMDHDAREANRQTVLAGRMESDLWVFAYGSLIWDPAVEVAEYRYAALPGWHRSFCMKLERGRGSFENPGLMAALEAGGDCDGVVFRIPGTLVAQETAFMWRREMFSGAYCPTFFEVTTPQGPVEALVFVINRESWRYLPQVDPDEAAQMIATAEGELGANFDYLDSLVQRLEDLGLHDEDIFRLHRAAVACRAASNP